jgi:predicted RNA-binding protein YlqC (UPF0109 family)
VTSVESGEYTGSEEEGNQQGGTARTASAVLRYLGVELTQHPDRVVVQEVTEGDKRVKLTLLVDKADMGRVIGRQGKIAGAIRAVVRAAGAKDGIDASVEIQERD